MPNECLSLGRKSKTIQFSLSNLCQSWVLPQMKQALLWAFGLAWPCPPRFSHPIHPSSDSFCQDQGTCPQAFFFLSFFLFFFGFFLHSTYGTFLLIASGACGATVQALLATSSQVMLCQLHTVTSAGVRHYRHGRRGAKERVWLCTTLQETKGKLLWAVLLGEKKYKTFLQ